MRRLAAFALGVWVGLAGVVGAAERGVVVFDGAAHRTGSAWSDPADSTSFGLVADPADKERVVLEFKGTWKNYWAGGGWNWTNWQGPGLDITPYAALAVTVRKTEGEKLGDLWVQLADTDNKTSPEVKLVETGKLKALGPDFAVATIPLADLGGGADFKKIVMFNVGLVPAGVDTGTGAVQIADIRFVPPQAE